MPQSQLANELFNSMPKDVCNLFEDGQVKGSEVVEILGYKKKEVAAATGVNQNSIRYDEKMPQDLENRLIEWATAINLVGGYFGDSDKTMLWFQTPNPLLGELSPRDMIRLGRFKKLLKFIRNALDDNRKV